MSIRAEKKNNMIKKFKLNSWEKRRIKDSIPLFVFLLPAVVYLFIFNYIPMYGITLAFKKFRLADGIFGSEWVGLKYFIRFINSPQFWDIIKNTLTINIFSFIVFPFPIILALLLNYCIFKKFKKATQMITYAPHFVSVVVLCGMVTLFLSPSNGIVNNIIELFGGERKYFMVIPHLFKYIVVGSDIWQNVGFSSIIYIGTLSTVNPELHEAAIIDGATKIKRIWHIDLPGISPTIIILLIMKIGRLMDIGFQKILLLQNGGNLASSEVISTYVYKIGLLQSDFSYSTAIGLFNTVINVILLITANTIAKKTLDTSLF